jgi:hypothetical protein
MIAGPHGCIEKSFGFYYSRTSRMRDRWEQEIQTNLPGVDPLIETFADPIPPANKHPFLPGDYSTTIRIFWRSPRVTEHPELLKTHLISG